MFTLAGVSAQAKEDEFVVAVGARNELLSPDQVGGSGYNGGQWHFYGSGWHSQWFDNGASDAGRKTVIALYLSVEPLDQTLPCRIIITYGWSTPQWSALGSATPPLPGAAPEGTYIQRHVAFQGYLPAGAKAIPVADTYEIRQYNPQWLSVDVQGENFVITDGRIKHESMPRTAGDIMLLQQQTEACCFKDGTCADLTPSACEARKGVPQGPGTKCLGDKNKNDIDDACEQQPAQCAPRADRQGCLNVTCPTTSDICVPTKIRVDPKSSPPRYTVLSCACQSPNLCHVAISSSGSVYCTGGCPAGQQCQTWATYNLDGTIDYECRCGAQPTEACCLRDGTCIDVDSQTCLQRGGTPQGPGTKCLGDLNGNGIDDACEEPTPETVACCLPSGQCVDLKPDQCMARGGTPLAPGTKCETPEACCLPDGSCIMADPQCCRKAGGTPQGANTDCKNVNCPQPLEACCLPDGTCTDTTANDCRAKGGTPQGPGTNCRTVKCPQQTVEIDVFTLSGKIELDIPGIGLVRPLLSGTAKVHVYFEGANLGQADDDDGDGRDEVQTELIELKLIGSDPLVGHVEMGLHPTKPSLGQIEERAMYTPGILDLPPFTPTGTADSFFDVFIEVDLPDVGLTLYGELANRLTAVITHKPPAPCDTYQSLVEILLVDAPGNDRGSLSPLRLTIGTPGTPGLCEACCLPDGTCIYTTKDDCANRGGTAQGAGTDCSTVSCLPPGECEWNTGDPHKMHFPQLPDLQGWDWEVPPATVADDWKCSETGAVTDIHFWYSWQGDTVGIIDRVHVGIFSNNPAGDGYAYSTPGNLLWERDFGPDELNLRHWATGNQGFIKWNIHPDGDIQLRVSRIPNDHKDIYQCNICNITDPFPQQAGQIYWLVLSITIRDPVGTHIGWKTSLDHFEDDAVCWINPTGIWGWTKVINPATDKWWALDLAFVITGREEAPPPPPVVEHTKWSQPPIEIDPKAKTPFYCGWDEPSFAIRPSSTTAVLPTVWQIVADDFRCLGNMPVTSVHWWGSYQGWDDAEPPAVRPTAWRIGFWSNVPANPLAKPGHSYPRKLLWRVDVPAQRVQEERAGYDRFPNRRSDTCFRYYVKFEPQEYFWQQKYIDSATSDDVFWISITAIYPPVTIPFQQWGWKTRPQHWMDDAVKFTVEGDLPLGYASDSPLIFTPIEAALCGQQVSFDMAFELDTDPSYIKWEQAFTGIRDWTHYQDEQSTAMEDTQGTPIIRRLVADDWPCEQITPITAAVWWGSYVGYRYKACDCPLMAAPLKPDYFLLSIWTDVRPAANAPFSRPGEKIWEYKAENYDEVLVGYDKQPETVEPGQTPGYEPVFRYSVRLPREKWFCQKDLNSIYWFSVVAVYAGDKTPLHPWGWTNHPRVDWQVVDPTVPPNIAKNDDAVAGYLDTTGATAVWKWQELHDQTGVSTDMSFMLFTEPGCFPCTYSTYNDWLTLGKPDCWCEPPYGSGYQCDGDADGVDSGGINKFRVFTGDLSLIVANWRKKAGDPALDPCADIDHKDSGGINKFRVFTGDLSTLVANWRKKDAALPGDCPRPE
jgi:hypothetical protein